MRKNGRLRPMAAGDNRSADVGYDADSLLVLDVEVDKTRNLPIGLEQQKAVVVARLVRGRAMKKKARTALPLLLVLRNGAG